MAACLGCEFKSLGFPCRIEGRFDAARVAQEYFNHVVRASSDDDAIDHWSYECIEEMCEASPADALSFVVEMLPLMETPQDAAYFAAGPLEVLVANSGETVIDEVETLARQLPRFRYLLSGVWPLGNSQTEIWARIEKARQGGAHIDQDPMPPV